MSLRSHRGSRFLFPVAWLVCSLVGLTAPCSALAVEAWRLHTSVYTTHFDPDPEHNNDSNLISLEAWRDPHWHLGLATFDNSFNQPTQFAYVGYSWDLDKDRHTYARLIGGLVHGYKDEYQDKIPFNQHGIAPAVIPAVGLRLGPVFGEVQVFGLSGAMMTVGFTFGGKH